ncbi:hypothetical protein UlMin_027801 [Ulmus minor]
MCLLTVYNKLYLVTWNTLYIIIIMDFLNLTDQDRVRCATFLLKRDARYWWETVKLRRNVTEMTWEEFIIEFNLKYYNQVSMRAKQSELINLRQGKMTMTKAIRKFDQLARLCPTLVRMEEDRVIRLLEVFWPELTTLIETREHPPTTMADCVSRALRAESQEEHGKHLRIALQTLKEHHLYAKFSKCEFWLEKVQFLGQVISREGVLVDPSKIQTVSEWPTPTSYYRRFVEGFSKLATPLTTLTRKGNKYIWTEESTLMSIQALPRALQEDIQRLAIEIFSGHMSALTLQPTIFDGIKGAQGLDLALKKLKDEVI